MPLPSVLRPDAAEGPLSIIFVDAVDRLVKIESDGSFRDLFILCENVMVSLPFVVAKSAVSILCSCSQVRMIWAGFYLVEEQIKDGVDIRIKIGQLVEIVIAAWVHILVNEIC